MKKRPATEHHGCKNNETKYTDVANGLLPRPAVFFPTENMDIPGRTAAFSAFGGGQRKAGLRFKQQYPIGKQPFLNLFRQYKNPAGNACGMTCFPGSVLREEEDPLAVGFRGVHLKGLVTAVAFRVIDDLDMIGVRRSVVNNRAAFV